MTRLLVMLLHQSYLCAVILANRLTTSIIHEKPIEEFQNIELFYIRHEKPVWEKTATWQCQRSPNIVHIFAGTGERGAGWLYG